MRLLTTQLLVYFVCSIQASLVLFPNSFNDCTPPTKPVCSINDVYCDNNSNNPQYSNTNFNAAFVVSEAEKNADGSYNVVGNYQAAQSDQLFENFAQNVDQIYISGTGVNDATIYSQTANNPVNNPFKWSAKFRCQPQIKHGKCCIPDGLKLCYKFKQGGAGGAILNTVFGQQQLSYYNINPLSGDAEPYDPNNLFNEQLLFHKRDEEAGVGQIAELSKRTPNGLLNF